MTDPAPDPLADLRRANAELTAARRAALNVMEDTILARDALREGEDRQAFLLRLSDALRPLADPAGVKAAAARLLGEYLGADGAAFAELLPDGEHMAVEGGWVRPGAAAVDGVHRGAAFGAVFGVLAGGGTAVVGDAAADPVVQPHAAAWDRLGVRAAVAHPLFRHGRFAAAFFVHSAAPRRWAAGETALVAEVGGRTWEAVGRARAEAAVRASEERLRAVAANLPSGAAFVVDRDLRYVLAGGQALAPAGLDPATLEGKTLAEALPPAVAAAHAADYRRALAGEPFRLEHESHGRHYVTHGVPLRDAAGAVTAALAVSYDITDRKAAEAAARVAGDRLRLALTAARMGIWTWDVGRDVHARDANLSRLLGLPETDAEDPVEAFYARVHPADRDRVRAAFADAAGRGGSFALEFRVTRPDGAVRWLRDQGDALRGPGGAVAHLAGACVDVTDRAEAEAAVRASEERLKQIVDAATDYAILTTDAARRVTGWSPGARATFGYAAADILGRPSDVLFTPEDRAADAPAREAETARRDGRAADERWHLRHDGTRFYASGVLSPLAAGGFVKVARDLTDRKRTEDALREARDRLEERVAERTAELAAATAARGELLGRLVTAQEEERRRIARELHDSLGQYLAALNLGLAAARDAAARPETRDRLDRLAELTAETGREVHRLALELRPTALDDLGLRAALRQYVEGWAARSGIPAEFSARGPDGERFPWPVSTAVYRVVQESLTNVLRHARATRASVLLEREPDALRVVVEDDGVGFDPDAAAAAPRAGGGLGLLGMRERILSAGGTLQLESAPGAGTTVFVRIPLPAPEAADG